MTLSFYIARMFLKAYLIVTFAFTTILFLVNLAEELRRFVQSEANAAMLSVISLLKLPKTLYEIMPLIMVLSAVVLFVGLSRRSELVIVRASGRSALRMLVSPVLVAFLIGLFAIAAGNPIVAATQNRYEQLRAALRADASDGSISINKSGVWMRQSARLPDYPLAQAVIHARQANGEATQLFDVSFQISTPDKGPVQRLIADEALLVPGAWQLTGVKQWPLDGVSNPETAAKRYDTLDLPTDLTAARIRESFGKPSDVPLWQLPAFIASLEEAGFSTRRHQVWMLSELALPAFLTAMVLIAAAFTMRHARQGRTEVMVLLAFGAGLGLFFLRNVAQVLGESGQVPVMLAAFAPPVIALILPLALVLHLEEG